MDELRGKVAVVTGAASGIGYALAARFAAEGMGVVLADVERDALAGAAARLRSTGADVVDVPTDVSRAEEVDALAEAAEAHFGAVHVVCNNAGVSGGISPSWDTPLEDWTWTLGVNLWGVIHGVRSFVPRLIAQGEGQVVNTASIAGLLAGGVGAPYNVSKFGVVALSEHLYLSLLDAAPGVGVSVLCPGWVNTRIADSDRNRPKGPPPERTDDPLAAKVRTGVRRVLEAGMDPAAVADKVLDAVRDGAFYVLPHDDEQWLGPVRQRTEDIVERRNPTPRPMPGIEIILAALAEDA